MDKKERKGRLRAGLRFMFKNLRHDVKDAPGGDSGQPIDYLGKPHAQGRPLDRGKKGRPQKKGPASSRRDSSIELATEAAEGDRVTL